MRIILLGPLLFLMLLGCQRGSAPVEQPTFDEQAFANLYADILIIRSQSNPALNPEQRIAGLLQRRELSVATYEEILTYYQKYPERWLTFLDQVDSLITARSEDNPGSEL